MLVAMSFGVIFLFLLCFWLTNTTDTRPLHTHIRRLFGNLTKYFLVAEGYECRVVADDEDDASGREAAEEISECFACICIKVVGHFV